MYVKVIHGFIKSKLFIERRCDVLDEMTIAHKY